MARKIIKMSGKWLKIALFGRIGYTSTNSAAYLIVYSLNDRFYTKFVSISSCRGASTNTNTHFNIKRICSTLLKSTSAFTIR